MVGRNTLDIAIPVRLGATEPSGCSSMVERYVANVKAVGSCPTTRSKFCTCGVDGNVSVSYSEVARSIRARCSKKGTQC